MDILQRGGNIVVGGIPLIEVHLPEHKWSVDWELPSRDAQQTSRDALHELGRRLDPKRDSRDMLTKDHLFLLSPCLSAFSPRAKSWCE
jgi:hypothetical protein